MESCIYFHAPVVMLQATKKTWAWGCQGIICTSSNQSPAQTVIIPLHSKSHWTFGYLQFVCLWIRAALKNTDVFLLILFVLCSGHTRSHWAAGNPSRTWSHKRNGVCVEPSDWGLLLASLHCWAQLIYLNRMDYEGEDAHINTFFFFNASSIGSHQGQFRTVVYALLDIHSSAREPSWLSWERWFKSSGRW